MKRLLILLLLLAISPTLAALPPISDSSRERLSDVIVEAQVLEVSTENIDVRYGKDTKHTLALCVQRVVKS